MYVPAKFALSKADTHAWLAGGGFAQLVTESASGMQVTALPLLYEPARHSLIGHVARANPHWQAAGGASVAIFTGLQGYISPSLYATKQETGKVVPTWNYDILVVHGRLAAHDDPDWLRDLVTRLTDHHERDRAQRWRVTDAPAAFVDGQLNGIVGIEMAIDAVEGKAKMSQNQPERNRAGIVAGLRESPEGNDQALAARVAELGSTNANGRANPRPDSRDARSAPTDTARTLPDDGS